MVEIKNIFNKAIEHVVDICGNTLNTVEKSQNDLMLGLEELERRLNSISELNQRLNSNQMTEAYQNIEIYKARIERIKGRLGNIKKRINYIEVKVNGK